MMALDQKDLRIDTFRNSGPTQWTRITYLPLGLVLTFTGRRGEDLERHAIREMARFVEKVQLIQNGKTRPQGRPPGDAVDGHAPERGHDDPDEEAG